MELTVNHILQALILVIGSFFFQTDCAASTKDSRPNIVVMMADDMGFSDIGCYGSEIATPNLDALAQDGVRFTQFYNTARCCPTRASLLTGLYPHQAGIGHMMDDRGHDGYRGELNRRCVTIAEALRPAGYRTYMAGKWHVTSVTQPKSESAKRNWPLQRGFDRFYGTIHGAGSFFDPNTLTRDNTFISPFDDSEYPTDDYYYTDAISDHAVRFIHEHHSASGDQPFFLYVAYTAAHWPMHARERDIQKHLGRYDAGYQATREARYQRMLELGVIRRENTTNWPLPESLGETRHWEWDRRNMEVFAAMVDNMDQGIGRVVDALKGTGDYNNTLICFLQDNGGCAEGLGRGREGVPRAAAPTLPPLAKDHRQPDMVPKQTRDGFPVRQGKGVMAGAADTYIAYGEAWSTVSNTPFRRHKHWVHEGGISSPLIVHWPSKSASAEQPAAHAGRLIHEPSHLIDIMATCLDVSGSQYPAQINGAPIKPFEGRSLRPLIMMGTEETRPVMQRPIFWEHEGNRAVREGRWKLVAVENGPWELYDIDTDRSEQRDLAETHPDRVRALAAKWDAYAERADVLPLGAWRVKKKAE